MSVKTKNWAGGEMAPPGRDYLTMGQVRALLNLPRHRIVDLLDTVFAGHWFLDPLDRRIKLVERSAVEAVLRSYPREGPASPARQASIANARKARAARTEQARLAREARAAREERLRTPPPPTAPPAPATPPRAKTTPKTKTTPKRHVASA